MGPTPGIGNMFIQPASQPSTLSSRKYLLRTFSMEDSMLDTASTVEDKKHTTLPLQNLLHVGKQI